jgi:hypothetical protein
MSDEPWWIEPTQNGDRAEIHRGERTTHPTDDYVTSPVVVALKVLPTIADAERVVACVNACRGIPTEVLQRVKSVCVVDNAKTLGMELRPTQLDLLAIAEILRKAGFDVSEPVSAGR